MVEPANDSNLAETCSTFSSAPRSALADVPTVISAAVRLLQSDTCPWMSNGRDDRSGHNAGIGRLANSRAPHESAYSRIGGPDTIGFGNSLSRTLSSNESS